MLPSVRAQLASNIRPSRSILGRSAVFSNSRYLQLKQVSRPASTDTKSKPFYVTTPIFYVNAPPHVGHLYSMVLADVLKRWQSIRGKRAILSTGVDEHGLKVQKAAEASGINPLEFCDRGAENFKTLATAGNITYDEFVRTTDDKHKDIVQFVWRQLYDRGLIYRKKHEGWYSVSDETFYPQNQVRPAIDPRTGRKVTVSIETEKEVEWASEENYHFRLSAFRERLLDYFDKNPDFITPAFRMEAIKQELEQGLQDLSISRPAERLKWGIPVPGDDTQTVYVWLDALLNYLVTAGYPFQPGNEAAGGWPVDVQVIGKDITRFHCVYWPAFLMALDIPLPSRILTHGHWTLGRKKMSKSDGNVVNPFFALDRFGTDVLRFFLVHDGGIQNDPEYNNELITWVYKDILQSTLGNLASRVTRAKTWDLVDFSPRGEQEGEQWSKRYLTNLSGADNDYLELLQSTASKATELMDGYQSREALQALVELIRTTNKYITSVAPWSLIPKPYTFKSAMEAEAITPDVASQIKNAILLSAESVRIVAIFLQPVMPQKASMLLDHLGVAEERRGADYAAVFADPDYGLPTQLIKKKDAAQLFPPLTIED